MDPRFVGTWRIVAVAARMGAFDEPDPTWDIYPPYPEHGRGLAAVAHTFRADGTAEISDGKSLVRSEQVPWRLEEDGGELYLTFDMPQGPIGMRVWFRPDGTLVWEQNIFSRRCEAGRLWFNPVSGQWVGRDWPAQLSGATAFVFARDAAPSESGSGPNEPTGPA
jgi:hypothetical protein